MNRIRYILLGALFALLAACENVQPTILYTIEECTAMPLARACATSFVVGKDAYIFGGRDSSGTYLNDLWRYDTSTNTWHNLGETPLEGRVNATANVYNNMVYIGLGFNGVYSKTESYFTDWWCYDPTENIWTELSSFPASTTARAISLVGDGELFIGYGFCWTYERDMYRYDIANNRWTFIDVHLDRKAFTFPTRSFGGVGTTCQGRHFAGTGFRINSLNWWGEFLPEGQWIKRQNIPGKRTTAACTATDNYVYVIGGTYFGGVNTDGRILSDIQQYDPQTDTWQHVGDLPNGGRINHVAFRVGKRIFVGLGENEEIQVCGDLYCIYEK